MKKESKCAFCGGELRIWAKLGSEGMEQVQVRCEDCEARGPLVVADIPNELTKEKVSPAMIADYERRLKEYCKL